MNTLQQHVTVLHMQQQQQENKVEQFKTEAERVT